MQRTIAETVELTGAGLFSGQEATIRFCPASEDSGLTFVRVDVDPPVEIRADIDFLVNRPQRTTSLSRDGVSVDTVEHVLAACVGLDLDNVRIEVTHEEIPNIDGSAWPFVEALLRAGIEEQDIEREVYVIDEPIVVSKGAASLSLLPGPTTSLEVIYELAYETPSVGTQLRSFKQHEDDFVKDLAPARTFLLESEARMFREKGFGLHLTASDVLVMGDDGPIDNELRFTDEHVRHKILDLLGDFALLGRRIAGRIVATRSGHDLNHELIADLAQHIHTKEQMGNEPAMDIRKIMRLLPHRYPMLMVDRVLELDGDRRAVGVKNVTINEPMFQGHYPNLPIFPGVLIVEAMAQLSGILMGRRLEHTGKVAVLLSMDRVKMRRPVRPGDQMILEAEALHARTRTGHCKCRALVGGEVAAEAEIKFMLVDNDPI